MVAVGAAVVVCAAARGQSGLVTTTVAGTATADRIVDGEQSSGPAD